MIEKQSVNTDKRNVAYILVFFAFIVGFFLAKKYYVIVWLWYIIPFPVTLGDYYVFLLDDPVPRAKSLILGIISLAVTLYFIRRIYKENDTGKKLKLGFISLIVSIIFSLSFYVVTPSYTFQNYPKLFMYMDSKGEYIQNPEYYFWLVEKLGFYQETYRPFKTLDDSIKGLEFAKRSKDKTLYSYIFGDIEKFGFEKILDSYKDVTFQLYFLTEIVGRDYDSGESSQGTSGIETYIKDITLVSKLKNSKSKIIQEIVRQIETLCIQYTQGTLDKNSFLIEMRAINLSLYKRTQNLEGVEYSIF